MENTVTREWAIEAKNAHDNLKDMVLGKYLSEDESSLDDVRDRVMTTLNNTGTYDEGMKSRLSEMITEGRFIPAGSILSSVGSKNVKSSASNCYVHKIKKDSLWHIYQAFGEIATTYAHRGGVGVNFDILRPNGSPVSNAARTSTGPLEFMAVLSLVTKTTAQNGRRGASLMALSVWHPDVLRFIDAKWKPEEVFEVDPFTGQTYDITGANLSVILSDDFMEAVESNKLWEFVFPDIEYDKEFYEENWDGDLDKWIQSGGEVKNYGAMPAREVLNKISEAAHACGDPGVLFMDTTTAWTPGSYIDAERLKPTCTNPCGEEPMAPYSNCLLGALCLHKYVESPWTDEARFNYDLFYKDVYRAVYFMELASEYNLEKHPLEEQRDADKYGKRIGVEFTGLADTLAMLGHIYGTRDSIDWVRELLRNKAVKEIKASLDLAKLRRSCEALETKSARRRLLENPYIERLNLSQDLKTDIEKYGLRHTAWNTVGPTGSISILSGNCSSGIEPIFAFSYQRQSRMKDNQKFTLIHGVALDHIINNFDEYEGMSIDELKNEFNYVEASDLGYKQRIAMQSAVQEYTDAAVSSTVNLSEETPPDVIYNIYMQAWKANLKGITVFRDGCKTGVLSKKSKPGKDEESQVDAVSEVELEGYKPIGDVYVKELLDEERAVRHRVIWKNAKMYVTISLDDDDKPVEIFVKLPREAGFNGGGYYKEEVFQEKFSLWETVTRLTSLLLRADMPLEKIIQQLDRSSYSMVDASAVLARVLRKYLNTMVDYEDEEIVENALGNECSHCGAYSFVYEGGCGVCKSCGYTECG